MSITGIGTNPAPIIVQRPDRDAGARDTSATAPAATSPQAPVPRTQLRGPQSAIPLAPPTGTDPELWSVLTSAEREFFARNATQGPLTYSRAMSSQQPPAPPVATARGGRVDIRV